jgi:hypothetical protein
MGVWVISWQQLQQMAIVMNHARDKVASVGKAEYLHSIPVRTSRLMGYVWKSQLRFAVDWGVTITCTVSRGRGDYSSVT